MRWGGGAGERSAPVLHRDENPLHAGGGGGIVITAVNIKSNKYSYELTAIIVSIESNFYESRSKRSDSFSTPC
jgi:hypothetical protein